MKANYIKSLSVYQQEKLLNRIQKEILIRNHGGEAEASRHVKAVNSLIDSALAEVEKTEIKSIKIHDWQSCGVSGSQFNPDLRSIHFHRVMNRMKAEAGLI